MEAEYTHPQHRPSFSGPMAPLGSTGRKRTLADLHSPQTSPLPRAIQPKPPNSVDRFAPLETRPPVAIPRITDAPVPEQPRKRRGRPSKVELQRRAMATQKLGEPYSPLGILSERRPTSTESAPVTTSEDSSQLPGDILHQHVRPEQINQRQMDTSSTPQTHDMQSRQLPGPEVGAAGGTTLPPLGSRELTPRTFLDSRMSQSSVSFGPSHAPPFKILHQSGAGSASPEVETTFPSNSVVTTGPVVDNIRPAPGMEEGKDSLRNMTGQSPHL